MRYSFPALNLPFTTLFYPRILLKSQETDVAMKRDTRQQAAPAGMAPYHWAQRAETTGTKIFFERPDDIQMHMAAERTAIFVEARWGRTLLPLASFMNGRLASCPPFLAGGTIMMI